ncbi:MAG: 30S ribosomal protein S6 [Planctomycetota bacterium]|jgi:small subunit ribosomal protein S6
MVEKKLYEGMFLVDSAKAASDWDGVNAAINKILEKAGAEIVSMRKWDDRKLAYDIRGTGRGTYLLCYFKVDGQKIQGIEKAVQLSEKIIRVLILSTEQMTTDDIEKDTPATKAEKEKEKAVAEKAPKAEVSEQAEQKEAPVPEEAPTTEEAPATEEAPTTEEAPVTEVAPATDDTQTTKDIEPAGETELTEATEEPEAEKTEEAGQAEEIEAEQPQEESQPKTVSDD